MKTPEEIGREYSDQWYEAKPGTPYRTISDLIAAAIREDRAEMVSEEEVEAGITAYFGENDDIFSLDGARDAAKRDMRRALEAARKARAG